MFTRLAKMEIRHNCASVSDPKQIQDNELLDELTKGFVNVFGQIINCMLHTYNNPPYRAFVSLISLY